MKTIATSMRLSEDARSIIGRIGEKTGLNATAVVEWALRHLDGAELQAAKAKAEEMKRTPGRPKKRKET